MPSNLSEWLERWISSGCLCYGKRLSANDTAASRSHQAGPYIPKSFLFQVLPLLNRPQTENPDSRFRLHIDSHGTQHEIRGIWYNNRLFGGTRDETRLTNFGGRSSALLDPENTGAIALFSFSRVGDETVAHVWVARNVAEEDLIEDKVGLIEPGRTVIWPPLIGEDVDEVARRNCWLEAEDIPAEWLGNFPTGLDIVRKVIEFRPEHALGVDDRILRRRECEYEIFRSVEKVIELPRILEGFTDIDAFLDCAQTILQRRKARSGRSLELHAVEIFREEGLVEGGSFSHQPESESGKSPDFLFPSESSYKDNSFPADRLRMLAIKTTCKDRWRQVLNEADRIQTKHLLTLQEGVSEGQFREMTESRVKLVVPQALHGKYPESVRPHLINLARFLDEVRSVGST